MNRPHFFVIAPLKTLKTRLCNDGSNDPGSGHCWYHPVRGDIENWCERQEARRMKKNDSVKPGDNKAKTVDRRLDGVIEPELAYSADPM